MTIIELMREKLENRKDRSAWSRGVNVYAMELLEGLEESINGGWFAAENIGDGAALEKCLLNGAGSWEDYSWGGSSLIYDGDICERLCAPWEIRKTHGGERRPNAREEWLDTQARALYQASRRVKQAAREALEEMQKREVA